MNHFWSFLNLITKGKECQAYYIIFILKIQNIIFSRQLQNQSKGSVGLNDRGAKSGIRRLKPADGFGLIVLLADRKSGWRF